MSANSETFSILGSQLYSNQIRVFSTQNYWKSYGYLPLPSYVIQTKTVLNCIHLSKEDQ